jgi:glucose-1-phosphate thymidylyltransferase
MDVARGVIIPPPAQGDAADTRQLVPIANKPLVLHNVEALGKAGIRQIALAVDRRDARNVRASVGDGRRWGVEVSYLELEEPADAAGVLRAAGDFLHGEPFVVQWGGALLRDAIVPPDARFASEELDALVLTVPTPQSSRGGLNGGPAYEVAGGCFLFSPAVRDAAWAANDAPGGLDPLVERVREAGGRVRVQRVEGCLPLSGDHRSLLRANRQVLETAQRDVQGEVLDSDVEGRVVIDATAVVHRSTIRGPVVIGPGARISDAYVGPYTAIGRDVVIEGAEVEYAIVLAGARISFIDQRIAASVIGRDARIAKSFQLPRGVSFIVSDGAEVVLS